MGIQAPHVADPLFSSVNDSTPMHMIVCGARWSAASCALPAGPWVGGDHPGGNPGAN